MEDPSFINDSTVYYNLPKDSNFNRNEKRRATFPKLNSSLQNVKTSSCPSSPKQSKSLEKTTRRSLASGSSGPNNCPARVAEIRKSLFIEKPSKKPIINGIFLDSDCSKRNSYYNFSYKTMSEDESNSLASLNTLPEDSIRQTGHGTSLDLKYSSIASTSCSPEEKPKKKSIFPSWWKKNIKKDNASSLTSSKQIEKKQGNSLPIPLSLSRKVDLDPAKIETPTEVSANPHSIQTYPNSYITISQKRNSTSSASTLYDEDDYLDCREVPVYGGITYKKPISTSSLSEPSSNTSQKNSLITSPNPIASNIDQDVNDDQITEEILLQLKDYQKKYRWMIRWKKLKNPRYKGEGDVDIAIIHYGSESLRWAQYLQTNFSILLYDNKPGSSQVRIELFDIESLRSQLDEPENLSMVQSSRLRESMLQILILSPHFMTFLQSTPSFDLSRVLNQDRIVPLLLGVTWLHVKDTSVAAPFLYSLKKCLQVRDNDASFVVDVREQSLKTLNSNPIFENFVSSPSFSLCPRKVTPSQTKVHIHLRSQINEDEKRLIKIVLQVDSTLISVDHVYQNPYTLSFTVPDQFLGRSEFISVNLYNSESLLGFRKLKSETTTQVLKEILAFATDPLDIMCQALNISSVDGKLDTILAQGIKERNLPPAPVNIGSQEAGSRNPYCGVYPTWLHFAAAFGLEKYAWALLNLPGSQNLLYAKNQKGKTPAKLALEEGYTKLAEELENYALVTSLTQARKGDCESTNRFNSFSAPKVVRPVAKTSTSHIKISSSPDKEVQELLSNYDTPPRPRSLSVGKYESQSLCYANLKLDSSPVSESLQEESYLDMTRSTSLLRQDYENEVTALVTAWDLKEDARTFLKDYKDAIYKIKESSIKEY